MKSLPGPMGFVGKALCLMPTAVVKFLYVFSFITQSQAQSGLQSCPSKLTANLRRGDGDNPCLSGRKITKK